VSMSIEYSTLEERAEAEKHMEKALRILNDAMRRTHFSGLSVEVHISSMPTSDGTVPQLVLSTLDRQRGAI
jgi:hypothetical protein